MQSQGHADPLAAFFVFPIVQMENLMTQTTTTAADF